MGQSKAMLGKRAQAWLPAKKEAIVLILFFIVMVIFFYFILYAGRSGDLEEVKKTGQELRDQATLHNLMRSPVRTSITEVIEQGFGKETTYSNLIAITAVETNENLKDRYKELLESRAEFILNNAYGEKNWQLKLNIPGNFLEFGDVGGTTVSSEAIIPSYDGKLIKVYLITEEE